jgi:hypothetical protein
MALGTGGRIAFDYDMKIAVPIEAAEDARDAAEAKARDEGAAPPPPAADLWPLFAALEPVPLVVVHGATSDILRRRPRRRWPSAIPIARWSPCRASAMPPRWTSPRRARRSTAAGAAGLTRAGLHAMTRSASPARRLHVLHLHSTFDAGGKERRSVALMNRFGAALDHSVVSAQPGAMGARSLLARGLSVHFPLGFPSLTGKLGVRRLQTLARGMQGFDLICTYNWGRWTRSWPTPCSRRSMAWRRWCTMKTASTPTRRSGSTRAATGSAAWRWPVPARWSCLRAGWKRWRARSGISRRARSIAWAMASTLPPMPARRPDALPRVIKRPGKSGWAPWRACAR